MRAINEAHVAEPGPAVVDIAAADTATAVADRTHREDHRADQAGQRPAQAMRYGCATGRPLRIGRSPPARQQLRGLRISPHLHAPGHGWPGQSAQWAQPPRHRLRRPGPPIAQPRGTGRYGSKGQRDGQLPWGRGL
ncbi:DUF6207 family protein [Streptomyces sp. NPDC047461]|uniref:DUF6207 family protein n=1 Tax=Streptomyces sp. NPDC047461 TaxID=3155619 RepID=UPI0033DD0309